MYDGAPSEIEVPTIYSESYKTDNFWQNYYADRTAIMAQGMKIGDELQHRLHAWQVSGQERT